MPLTKINPCILDGTITNADSAAYWRLMPPSIAGQNLGELETDQTGSLPTNTFAGANKNTVSP